MSDDQLTGCAELGAIAFVLLWVLITLAQFIQENIAKLWPF